MIASARSLVRIISLCGSLAGSLGCSSGQGVAQPKGSASPESAVAGTLPPARAEGSSGRGSSAQQAAGAAGPPKLPDPGFEPKAGY